MKSKINIRPLLAILVLFTMIMPSTLVEAQGGLRVDVNNLSDAEFPEVTVNISVSDVQGKPVIGLTKSNFSISEDGQPVSDFDVAPVQNMDEPLAIALVMDTSGSMATGKPAPLEQAVQAAKTFIGNLAPQDYLAVIQFSKTVRVVQDLTTDRDLADAALDSLVAGGDTALYDSIVQAVNVLKNRSERRLVVLITDGRDSGPGVSQYTFDMAVAEAQRWAIPVYPIGFGEVDKDELQRLASLTGGIAQIQPDSSSLGAAFSVVLQILREQYLIRFTSGLQVDNMEHTLLIALDYQNWHEEISHTFVARVRSVTVTLPDYQNGQVVGGKMWFAPEALAPAPIARLDVSVDAKVVGSVTTEPFEYEWDSTTVEPGLHDLVFTMTDTAGNSGQASVQLDVRLPITVTITKPAEGEAVSDLMVASAEVAVIHNVAAVEFFVDGNAIGQKLTAAPYEVEFNPANYVAGPHILSVKATDDQGFTAEAQVNVNVVIKPKSGLWWLALLALLVVAGVLIPLALRQRRKLKKQAGSPAAPSSKTGGPPPAFSKPGEAVLRELEGLNPNQVWALGAGEARLGRKSDENDILLKGLNASRRHAVIRYEGGQYVIYGLSPNNPVIVNDFPISQASPLRTGDIIRLGETILRFE